MSKNTKETGIALRSELQEKLSAITNRLTSVDKLKERPFQTSGQFKFTPAAAYATNLHKLGDLRQLIEIMAFLNSKQKEFHEAADLLGLKQYPNFTWEGSSYDAWKNDIQIRVDVVTNVETMRKLNEAKHKLESFLTQEDRLAMVLKELDGLV